MTDGSGDSAAHVEAARRSGVHDERVLSALRDVPREGFVPPEYVGAAGVDRPIPIASGQVTTQPSLVASMVAALELAGGERVLEIGTGLGYQAAILARLAAEVWTVERFGALAADARDNLGRAGVTNVHVVVGDGTLGLPAHAPYDAIIVAAAFPEVPDPLVDQIEEGGRLVQPIGSGGAEQVTAFAKRGGELHEARVVTGAHFVRLVGDHGFAR